MLHCECCKHMDKPAYEAPCQTCVTSVPGGRPTGWESPESESQPGMTGQYTGRGGIEPIDFIKSNKMSFLEGNVIKYVYRYPFKGGIEALKKARCYLDWLIEEVEREEKADA